MSQEDSTIQFLDNEETILRLSGKLTNFAGLIE